MTADERLALVRVKIERAKQHIRELNAEVKSFFDTHPYVIGTKRNPQTRQLIYYVTSVRETPITLAAIAGDVLQNLRSALDHLAYQLVLVGTSGVGSAYHVSFPIADDAAKYKSESIRKVKGMRQDGIDAINAIKPYKGGNDTLWRLHKLNNIDKHRFLITVGSAFRSINLMAHAEQVFRQVLASDPNFSDFGEVKLPKAFFKSADRLFPLKAGDELFIDVPDAKVNEKMEFSFDVAFGEPQVVEGESLLETLQHMADLVDHLVFSFAPLLI